MLPDRSGPRAREHGHAQHLDTDAQHLDWSENELAPDQILDLDTRPARGHSYWSLAFRRLARKKLAMICLSLIILMYGGALLSPLVTPYDYRAIDLESTTSGAVAGPSFWDRPTGPRYVHQGYLGLRTTVISPSHRCWEAPSFWASSSDCSADIWAMGRFGDYAYRRGNVVIPRNPPPPDFRRRIAAPPAHRGSEF